MPMSRETMMTGVRRASEALDAWVAGHITRGEYAEIADENREHTEAYRKACRSSAAVQSTAFTCPEREAESRMQRLAGYPMSDPRWGA